MMSGEGTGGWWNSRECYRKKYPSAITSETIHMCNGIYAIPSGKANPETEMKIHESREQEKGDTAW